MPYFQNNGKYEKDYAALTKKMQTALKTWKKKNPNKSSEDSIEDFFFQNDIWAFLNGMAGIYYGYHNNGTVQKEQSKMTVSMDTKAETNLPP